MPHIQIEYSDNIKIQITNQLFNNIITLLSNFANINPDNCKCKIYKVKKYYLQSKINTKFIHLHIKILEGKSEKNINKIGEESIKLLQVFFKSKFKNNIQYSVEIQEIKKSRYFTTNKIN